MQRRAGYLAAGYLAAGVSLLLTAGYLAAGYLAAGARCRTQAESGPSSIPRYATLRSGAAEAASSRPAGRTRARATVRCGGGDVAADGSDGMTARGGADDFLAWNDFVETVEDALEVGVRDRALEGTW